MYVQFMFAGFWILHQDVEIILGQSGADFKRAETSIQWACVEIFACSEVMDSPLATTTHPLHELELFRVLLNKITCNFVKELLASLFASFQYLYRLIWMCIQYLCPNLVVLGILIIKRQPILSIQSLRPHSAGKLSRCLESGLWVWIVLSKRRTMSRLGSVSWNRWWHF